MRKRTLDCRRANKLFKTPILLLGDAKHNHHIA